MSLTRSRVWRSFLTIDESWGRGGPFASTANCDNQRQMLEHIADVEAEHRLRNKLVAGDAVIEGQLDVRVHLVGMQVQLQARCSKNPHEARRHGIRGVRPRVAPSHGELDQPY